ncbi:MAG TPA: AAA family ATPase [Vicinamibacterales bacterium]|nr:AAA family ATPase [Vicinamibacterales bacterium]
MAQLVALVFSQDEEFRRQVGALLRSGGVPIGLIEDRRALADQTQPDVVVVDIRGDAASGMAAIERLRASHPLVAIFAVASGSDPDLILQSMRAGANEFFTWPIQEENFHAALRRTHARRETTAAGSKQPTTTLVFFGAKGGAGTTTVAVNCAVELARLTKRGTLIADLKPCFGEVALFLGVRPRYTILDAIENLHRLDKDFLRELVAKHKSGLEILAGSEHHDRPGVADAGAIEELFRVLTRTHDFVVVDAGNAINSCTIAALYAADTIFVVATPDVPSVRNAQRLVDRIRQLGVGGERVRILLNRSSDQGVITPKQIETALGYAVHHSFTSDYKTVSTALNSGVPLALTNNSEIAEQFGSFTRLLIGADEAVTAAAPEKRRGLFSFSFLS